MDNSILVQNESYPIQSCVICLRKFYQAGSTFIIPFYQRPYEWGWVDTQLKGLFQTFFNENEENELVLDDPLQSRFAVSFEQSEYVVFGTIQLNKCETGYEIIDGQQRLTSFWLLLKAIEKMGNIGSQYLSFKVDNQISESLNSDFNEFTCDSADSNYSNNYKKLCNELTNRGLSQEAYEKLYGFILDHVLFSLMITDQYDIQETISIFDTLNTKGMSLGVKDVFKIKYYDYIKRHEQDRKTSEIFKTINEAYENCNKISESVYHVTEETLLDSFKLWVIMKEDHSTLLSKKITASPNQYFLGQSYSTLASYSEAKSLYTFKELSLTILQTQSIIKLLDTEKPRITDLFTLFSYDLLKYCGYGYFKNLLFVFAHALRMNRNERILTRGDVLKALEICKGIWMICSIAKISNQRVVNDFLSSIPKDIVIPFMESLQVPEEGIAGFFKNDDTEDNPRKWYLQNFKEFLEGDIYGHRQCWFFVVLSYLLDCSDDVLPSEQRKKLFYEWKYEIEHIVSRMIAENDENTDGFSQYTDHLGNLVFLTSSINSSLGANTKTISKKSTWSLEKKAIEDFTAKLNPNKGHIQNYYTESEKGENPSICIFVKNMEGKIINGRNDLYGIIKSRDDEKVGYIKELYNGIVDWNLLS